MISANVTGIDRADHRLTLTDDNGDTRNVKVAAETPIELIKVGDAVRVRLTRAVTISVEPPPASN